MNPGVQIAKVRFEICQVAKPAITTYLTIVVQKQKMSALLGREGIGHARPTISSKGQGLDMSTRRRISLALVAGIMAIVAGVGIATAATGGGSNTGSRTAHLVKWRAVQVHRRHLVAHVGTSISPTLKTHFSVFRHAVGAREAAVAGVPAIPPTTWVGQAAVAAFQLDLAQTHLVQQGAENVWVIPGAVGVCIVAEGAPADSGPLAGQSIPYATCDTTSGVLNRGLAMLGSEPDGSSLVFALVPDGHSSVAMTPSESATRQVPVTSNVAVADVPAGPVTLNTANANGSALSFAFPDRDPVTPQVAPGQTAIAPAP